MITWLKRLLCNHSYETSGLFYRTMHRLDKDVLINEIIVYSAIKCSKCGKVKIKEVTRKRLRDKDEAIDLICKAKQCGMKSYNALREYVNWTL